MRRFLCLMLPAALLAMMIAPAAFAISGQEALFGGGLAGSSGSQSSGSDVGADASAPVQYPTLNVGDSDNSSAPPYVQMLQKRLIELGYLRDAADGVYGENTRSAVYEFQKSNNLPETGIADAETQKKIHSDITRLVAAFSDDSKFAGNLTHVQNVLALWGFYGYTVDGVTGKNTEAAIKNFKAYIRNFDPSFGVTPTPMPTATPNPDGMFGDMPTIEDERLEDEGPVSDPLTDASITPALMEYINGEKPFTLFRQTIFRGDSGDEALRVQTRLRNLKYLYKADGAFGDVSELALKYFQRKNGLTETGIADESTQKALFSESAAPAEEYVFPYKLIVDVSDQRVYAMRWTGAAYDEKVQVFKCSTGDKKTPTPLGTFQAGGKKTNDEWYWFKDFHCYARWAYHIVDGVLFHSITYDKHKHATMSESSLGYRGASHGCVRLTVKAAKWIFDNCPEGTTVVVQE